MYFVHTKLAKSSHTQLKLISITLSNDGIPFNKYFVEYVDFAILLNIFQVLNATMDLRTVKHFFWKQSGDLVLHYRIIKR